MGRDTLRHRIDQIGKIVIVVVVLVYVVTLIMPIYFTIVSAFKSNNEIFADPLGLPSSISFAPFQRAEEAANLSGGAINSIIVTVAAEILTLALALPAAYAIVRFRGRLATWSERLFSLGFLIPTFAILLPTFMMAAESGLLGTRLFLILFYPATAIPISIVILVAFMRSIPDAYFEAAEIDGASHLQILRHVVVRVISSGIVTVVIINFLTFWNEFIFALVLTNQDSRTLQVAVPLLRDARRVDFGLVAAGIVLTLVPAYFLYSLIHERVQDALATGSGVK